MNSAEEAIRRFLRGDEEAFEDLVRQYHAKVYSLAWKTLGNREDAQDVLQETFLSAFRSLRGLRDPGSFSTWIYRVTLNHCRARWRSRDPEMPLDDPAVAAEADAAGGPPHPGRGVSPDRSAEKADLVRRALSGLPYEHRTAIVLKEYLGLSFEEVAAVMECPLSTAKSRLYHGLRGAQRNLRRLGVEPIDVG